MAAKITRLGDPLVRLIVTTTTLGVGFAVLQPGSASALESRALVARDVAPQAGLAEVTQTAGQNCIVDFDKDGIRDVLLSKHGRAWRLMKGNANSTFTQVNTTMFTDRDRHGCAVGDFGGVGAGGTYTGPDGLPDFYISVGACKGQCTKPYPNELWIQKADHTFVDAAAAFHVTDEHGRGREPLSFDFNNDGRADIFEGNEESDKFFSANRLFRNTGGDFSQFTSSVVTQEIGSQCSAAGDVDGDGWQDLVNCSNPNTQVLKNNSGTSFTDVRASLGLPTGEYRDAELADFNGDGRLDIAFIKQSTLNVRLNRNNTYSATDYTLKMNVGRNLGIGDADGDGKLDIYVVQGKNNTYKDLLLLNQGLSSTGKPQFTSFPVPQVTVGEGDTVQAWPNWAGTNRAAFLVNNGRWDSPFGPRQLIFLADS
jgi:FG-GAP-like repeat